jgi:hypothetical protein
MILPKTVAIAARPTSSSFAIRYDYTRQVISGDECPSQRETATTETPREIRLARNSDA